MTITRLEKLFSEGYIAVNIRGHGDYHRIAFIYAVKQAVKYAYRRYDGVVYSRDRTVYDGAATDEFEVFRKRPRTRVFYLPNT